MWCPAFAVSSHAFPLQAHRPDGSDDNAFASLRVAKHTLNDVSYCLIVFQVVLTLCSIVFTETSIAIEYETWALIPLELRQKSCKYCNARTVGPIVSVNRALLSISLISSVCHRFAYTCAALVWHCSAGAVPHTPIAYCQIVFISVERCQRVFSFRRDFCRMFNWIFILIRIYKEILIYFGHKINGIFGEVWTHMSIVYAINDLPFDFCDRFPPLFAIVHRLPYFCQLQTSSNHSQTNALG